MSISVSRDHRSPSISIDEENSSWDEKFSILGTGDEAEAIAALMGFAPQTRLLNGVLLDSRTLSLDLESHRIWRGKVNWKKSNGSEQKQPLEEGQSSFQFETTASQQHITHSLATVSQNVASGGTPVDFKKAINYDGKEVAGADIYVPSYSFSETHCFGPAFVTQAYKAKLFRLTGRTNNNNFRFFQPGEVLFLGASGTQRGDEKWEITFKFACSENFNNLSIGNISGINKKGWQLVWVYYNEAVESEVLLKKPQQVNVEDVYREGNYGDLSIGS